MDTRKTDLWFLLGLLASLVLFYPELVFAKAASLMGDHWEQHYPWAFFMADALRHGQWPFWTSMIQCGFPIAAESQMGIFYLPNLLLYGLLPIQWAYAYTNLLHFFLSGAGTYFYLRAVGIKPAGAFMAAVVFVFGTGYGGAYYNITSLKTLAWFPWLLWGFERFCDHFRKRYLLLIAVLMALALIAGYMQVAALMILVCYLYFLLRIFLFPSGDWTLKEKLTLTGSLVLVGVGGILLSSPQLVLTYELAWVSNRVRLTEDYAYVGSLPPPAILTVFLPKLQALFRGNCLYVGIFSLYFVMASFFSADKNLRRILWIWTTLTVISLLLALGQWSPLYVALIKLSHFYSFRIPAKFLIFVCFGLSVLSGLGVQVWIRELTQNKERLAALNRKYFLGVASLFVLWGAVYASVTLGRSYLVRFGEWVVKNFIHGKIGHPRSLESYMDAVALQIDTARDLLSLKDPWLIWAFGLLIISCLWIVVTRRVSDRRRGPVFCLAAAVSVLLFDLYVFAGEDIKRDFSSYLSVMRPNGITQALVAEKRDGKMGRLYTYRKEAEKPPVLPSVNMLYGIEEIGGYSPFIMSRYFETVGQFGNVNDSNQMPEADINFVLERLPLLYALDVSHVQSMREILHPDFELFSRDENPAVFLYRLRGGHARAFFVADNVRFADWPAIRRELMMPGFDPRKKLWLETGEQVKIGDLSLDPLANATNLSSVRNGLGRESWTMDTTGPGFFVVTNVFYPGWEARLDGREVPIFRAYGLFCAVWIPGAGHHSLELTYHPYHAILSGL